MTIAIAATAETVRASRPRPTNISQSGVIGPVRLFTSDQCRLITAYLRRDARPPADWGKGGAVTDRVLYELATRPALLAPITQWLGDDVILWGAQLIERKPQESHPWHTDIESSSQDGGFVSVWVGLENTSQESALQFITRSHLVGKTIQQVAREKGLRRGTASSDQILAWAKEVEPEAEFVQPQMSDGEALIFDGRLWHGSYNSRRQGTRLALLLQYAKADTQVRIPDFEQLEWPFRFLASQPPVIRVSGTSSDDINRITPPPPASLNGDSILFSTIHPLPLPLAEDREKPWRPHHIFCGTTPILDFMSCHISILSPAHSPHLPHAHAEEELLIVLDGEADLIISADPQLAGARVERARPGAFVYYPSYQHHTIRNSSERPVTYLMFKWRGSADSRARQPLATNIFSYDLFSNEEKPRWGEHLFNQATTYLDALTSHVTVLQPGAGYDPHIDPYDVTILLLAGTVETLSETVTAPCVIYYQAGEPHGMRNVGRTPARYLVFEFHGATSSAPLWRRVMRLRRSIVESVSRLGSQRRRLTRTTRRLQRRAKKTARRIERLQRRAKKTARHIERLRPAAKKTARRIVRRALPSWGIARAGKQLAKKSKRFIVDVLAGP